MDVEKIITENANDTAGLANEFTLHSFRISRGAVQKLFQKMTVNEYVIIWILSTQVEHVEKKQKIYLKNIAEKSKLPMAKISEIVRGLQEKGIVEWKHDGRGEEGTYIQITDAGIQKAIEQQKILERFYGNAIQKFGIDRFIQLMQQLHEFEDIMNQGIEQEL